MVSMMRVDISGKNHQVSTYGNTHLFFSVVYDHLMIDRLVLGGKYTVLFGPLWAASEKMKLRHESWGSFFTFHDHFVTLWHHYFWHDPKEMLQYYSFMTQCYSETKHHASVLVSESAFCQSFTYTSNQILAPKYMYCISLSASWSSFGLLLPPHAKSALQKYSSSFWRLFGVQCKISV